MLRLVVSAALGVAAYADSVTPLEKVTTLIENLKAEVETEGKNEAKTYDEFACFCKDKSEATSQSILSGEDSIEVLSANLADYTATKDTRKSELLAKKQEEEQLKRTLSETQVSLDKEKAAYDASDADLSKAISSLTGAITSLENAKSAPKAMQAKLLSVHRTIQQSLELADAMKLLDEKPKWHNAVAFLQQQTSVDPNDPEYKYHSAGIIEILQKLKAEFESKKSDADGEWAKTKSTLESTLADLNTQLNLAAAAIVDLNTAIDQLTSDIAETRGSLVEAENTLKEDQLYLNDLTKLCEDRAKEWDQRSQARKGELEALTEALSIIKGKVAETEGVNKRALLQRRPAAAAPSFLQTAAHAEVRAHTGTLLERARVAQQQRQQVVVQKAMDKLRQEGSRLKSSALVNLAARVTVSDPFVKVKGLIQGLIERLLQEATDEASKKGFCDTEVSKATQDRTFRYEATQKLNAQLRQLEAKRDALSTEIADLKAALAALNAALAEATSVRAAQKAENAAAIATADEGLKAVTMALGVLKNYYKQAAKNKVLLQVAASPVDKDLPSAAQGAYKGNQEASGGILGLLEVIKTDFERTITTTTKAEAEAAAQFVEFERASKADIASKTTKLQLNQEDLAATNSKIAVKSKDLQSNQNLLDEALRTLEELKPMCIDNGMSYEERAQKRDEEIAALKNAVCTLDSEGVEEICS